MDYNGNWNEIYPDIQPEQIIELNASIFYGNTAFMDACTSGHKGVVQLLLDHSDPNIELNARSSSGKTVFMMAIDLAFQNAYDE